MKKMNKLKIQFIIINRSIIILLKFKINNDNYKLNIQNYINLIMKKQKLLKIQINLYKCLKNENEIILL